MEALRKEREAREQLLNEHISTCKQKVGILDRELENINRDFEELENKKAKIAAKHGDQNVNGDDII
eukprot:15331055-Ditylum_brightwellii.AAC.1